MRARIGSSLDVLDWIRSLASRLPTFFPQPTGETSFGFVAVGADTELSFEGYRPTVVPPGKKLSPAREELVRFGRRENGGRRLEAAIPGADEARQCIAGVRPCDLRAIHLMDMVQRDGFRDPNYTARRQHTLLIGYACATPCDTSCYCDAVGSLDSRDGADVMLTPSGDELVIESLTPAGEELVEGTVFAPCDDAADRVDRSRASRPSPFGRQLAAPVDELPALIENVWDSPVWEKHVEKCFSCGTCNMVCPTCYCFDVRDDVDVQNPTDGTRSRNWDGCMLHQFAEVAGGHNFRRPPAARQRHRIKRKFEYLSKQYGEGSFCVGCGRCGRQCTSGIDIYDIVNDLVAAHPAPSSTEGQS